MRTVKKLWNHAMTLFSLGRSSAPIRLSRGDAERVRFCFLGEFGYELISWIPYLAYVSKTLGIHIKTAGRPGSQIVYPFSSDHLELSFDLLNDSWGAPESYIEAKRRFGIKETVVYPSGRSEWECKALSIAGVDWRNHDIHASIDLTHYLTPDFAHVPRWSPFSDGQKPLVVINNKYQVQWPLKFSQPVNYIDRESLIELRDVLLGRGFRVVYNHFVEPTVHDKYVSLDDRGIFDHGEGTCDLRDVFNKDLSYLDRNRRQLGLYNAASFVVGPQGGNLYLPAMCRRPLFVVMRSGEYRDYAEFRRVFGISVDMFYEGVHLVEWLRTRALEGYLGRGDMMLGESCV